jgi:hypothetical protein
MRKPKKTTILNGIFPLSDGTGYGRFSPFSRLFGSTYQQNIMTYKNNIPLCITKKYLINMSKKHKIYLIKQGIK